LRSIFFADFSVKLISTAKHAKFTQRIQRKTYQLNIIETSRLCLREWKNSDAEIFIEMNGNDKVMEFFPALLSAEETLAMIERTKKFIADHKFGFWAAERKDTNEFIGFVGLSIPRFQTDFTPCVEIGWRLAQKHWGNGFAPEAAAACLNYGFDILKLTEIVSFTSVLNTKSMNVMKKIGMHYVKDFEHPGIEDGNRLKTHVLYSKKAARL
jgi:RimJ/RimL family protein N-acetyltransferase